MNENKQLVKNELVHAFLLMTRIMNLNITYDDLLHKIGSNDNILLEDIIYASKEYYNLKSKVLNVSFKKLKNNPMPSLVKLKNNSYSILFSINEKEAIIYDFEESQKIILDIKEFENIFDNTLILFIKNDDLNYSKISNFGLGWFIKSFFKQNRLVYHVLFAAFIL